MSDGDIFYDASISVKNDDGSTSVVSGSKRVNRDLSSQFNWWGLRPRREIPPIPKDEHGNAMVLCSNGHYAPRGHFARDPGRPSGLDHYCKGCRKVMTHRWRYEQAERAGRVLRSKRGRPRKVAV